ncbi:hypothetical protein [Bartonella grahamii]|uniref:UDP-3-O-[3-hydroxymyristoyl] glucosamine N-acyltransferase n=2 Tax=Bartonella TaxID=773 RepID=A0A336NFF3_BARGR|nr:hypothetical protein [Bartonella grahamii]SSZ40897.1 UDP-3-O-[3-hydroxymyristoyl] glucosamine N-acyltransferase [Bartonella grahamii]
MNATVKKLQDAIFSYIQHHNDSASLQKQDLGKKYEFTDETIEIDGHVLHRIRALRDFGYMFGKVNAGDLGGFIEKEDNLSHEGSCWIFDNARVYQNALVTDNAYVACDVIVKDSATVSDNARVVNNVHISDNAKVCDSAAIYDNVKIYGKAFVGDTSCISENVIINGATVIGDSDIESDTYLSPNDLICDKFIPEIDDPCW